METTTGRPRGTASRWSRLGLARAASRGVAAVSRRTGRGAGGVIGGRVLLRLAPQATRELAAGRTVALVSGTNGKSTTSAMLAAALRASYPTESNADGANTPAGITVTLDREDADHVVLETDEGWLDWAVEQTQPAVALWLNLSRDQLHRHPEVRSLAASWRRTAPRIPVVVANADDPDVAWAATAAPRQVWVAAGQRWTQDSVVCPNCGRRATRTDDGWSCTCGFARPTPHWALDGDELVGRGRRVRLPVVLPGVANLANAAMAVAAAEELGVDLDKAAAAVAHVTDVAGRYAVVERDGYRCRLFLAKNPAGWLEAIGMLDGSTAPVVLAFNSEGVDGRDPSWLYDVSFRSLRDRTVVVCGRRAADMAVRLEMDGFGSVRAFAGLGDALQVLPAGDVDVVANYSAFQDARRWLRHGR